MSGLLHPRCECHDCTMARHQERMGSIGWQQLAQPTIDRSQEQKPAVSIAPQIQGQQPTQWKRA